MKRHWTTIIVLMGLFLLVPGRGFACPVPVFRYALERWVPDCYDAVIIHRGQTADGDPNVSVLRNEMAETLNLRLLEMNLASSTDEQIKGLLGDQVPENLPALALWYPWQRGRAAPLWVGELTSSTMPALADSPVRQELAKRLTKGHSAVWILLKSGNADKDAKTLELLKQELEEATRQLKEIPPYADELEVPGLSYEFSILPVSRSDPAEKMLLTMLLNSEPDLDEYKDEPIVFPVFGRGRVLFALVADGINADNIQETIAFLAGPCGCEIKAMNPGVDLLMDAHWDEAIMELYEEFYAAEEPLPELTSVFPEEPAVAPNDITSELAPAEAPDANNLTSAGDEQAQAAEVAQPNRRGLGVMGTAAVSVGGILVVVALGTLAVTRQRKTER